MTQEALSPKSEWLQEVFTTTTDGYDYTQLYVITKCNGKPRDLTKAFTH